MPAAARDGGRREVPGVGSVGHDRQPDEGLFVVLPSFGRFTSMLYSDNVVWLMRQECIVFMKKTVFTSITGAFTNQPAKFRRQIFAHSILASLPGAYPGLHHAHQKLGLLVLI